MTTPLAVDATGWWIGRLAAVLTGVKVDGETPADLEAVVPFVAVQRVGGGDDGFTLDAATMAFHCYAGAASQQAANSLAYQVGAAARLAVGVVVAGAVVTHVRTLSGPSWAAAVNPNLRHAVLLLETRITAV